MNDEYIDELEQQLDQLRTDHALTDRAIAAALRLFVRTGEFPEGTPEDPDVERTLLETASLLYHDAPALRARYLLVSSMHLDLVMSSDRRLDAIFDELRELDGDDPPDDEPDWLAEYRRLATRRLDGDPVDELQSRFDATRRFLAEHHQELRSFSRSVLAGLTEQFDEDVQSGALSPLVDDATADVDDPDEALHTARELQADGELDAAVELYSKVLEQRPDDVEARVQRGILRATLEDLTGAVDDLDRALELDDEHLVARLNRGLARHSLGNTDEAIDDYDRALELVDDDAEIRVNRGIARFSNDDFQKARRDFDRAIELDDSMPIAYYQRGNVHRVLRDVGPALEDYDRAIELDDQFVDAYSARGFLYLQLEDPDKARADLDRAIELQPSDPELYYNRAYTFLLSDDVESAIADYDRALELDPEDVESLANRGAAHMMNGDLERAAEDWEEAIRINPYYPTPYLKRASMWIATEEYEQAIEDLEIALKHAPDDWPHRRQVEETLDDLRDDLD